MRRALRLIADIDRGIERQAIAAVPVPFLVRGKINQGLDAFQRTLVMKHVIAADHMGQTEQGAAKCGRDDRRQ